MKVRKKYKYSIKKYTDQLSNRASFMKELAEKTGRSYSHVRKWPNLRLDDPRGIKAEHLKVTAELLDVDIYDLLKPYEVEVCIPHNGF